jgi:carbon monoxide dehydrogenase subunit G
MSDISTFESRTGRLTCNAGEVYNFLTDIRNMEQVIPSGTVSNWKSDGESCSFRVNPLGDVDIRLSEKVVNKKVVFSGNALQVNNFSLIINISGIENQPAEVRILLSAEMNPVLKMIAAGPVRQFLDTLINEMEKFQRWNDLKV